MSLSLVPVEVFSYMLYELRCLSVQEVLNLMLTCKWLLATCIQNEHDKDRHKSLCGYEYCANQGWWNATRFCKFVKLDRGSFYLKTCPLWFAQKQEFNEKIQVYARRGSDFLESRKHELESSENIMSAAIEAVKYERFDCLQYLFENGYHAQVHCDMYLFRCLLINRLFQKTEVCCRETCQQILDFIVDGYIDWKLVCNDLINVSTVTCLEGIEIPESVVISKSIADVDDACKLMKYPGVDVYVDFVERMIKVPDFPDQAIVVALGRIQPDMERIFISCVTTKRTMVVNFILETEAIPEHIICLGFEIACYNHYYPMLRVLLLFFDPSQSPTSFIAVALSRSGFLTVDDTIKVLLDDGRESLEKEGFRSFLEAVRGGRRETVKLLLDAYSGDTIPNSNELAFSAIRLVDKKIPGKFCFSQKENSSVLMLDLLLKYDFFRPNMLAVYFASGKTKYKAAAMLILNGAIPNNLIDKRRVGIILKNLKVDSSEWQGMRDLLKSIK